MKKLIKIILVVLLLLSLTGCPNVSDWSAEGLPGGYKVFRANSRNVALCLPNEEYPFLLSVTVPSYVYKLAYTDDFIFVKRGDVVEWGREYWVNRLAPDYYIVSVEDGICHGPYTVEEFRAACRELGVEEELKWMGMTALRRHLRDKARSRSG